jgi:hypothetical protein
MRTDPGFPALLQAGIVHRPFARSGFALVLAAVVSACAPYSATRSCVLPDVDWAHVAAVPGNVIAAVVTARVSDADSVSVRFERDAGPVESSARVGEEQAEAEIPVFGLHESSAYDVTVHAFNDCGTTSAEASRYSTGSLPADLPRYQASGADPSPGFVAFAAGSYGIVIDNTGRTVWYHRFPTGPGLNFQAQRNGRYLARPAPPPGQPARWIEVDALGNVTRTLSCAHGMSARMHDILVEADGSWWLMCDELRTMNLSSSGLSTTASVLGTAVQRFSATGTLLFEWSPFDHLEVDVAGLDPADRNGAVVNWTHGNSFDIDFDGNLLISYRNLDEILKIDVGTGSVMWRMGGRQSHFDISSAAQPFRRQHSVRATARGELTLLDNLGHAGPSRMERYRYDEATHSAQLIASHTSSAGVTALTGGTVQQLSNGRTLVSFGSGGNVEEVDAAGKVVWKLDGNPGYVFRAQRIVSLSRPGAMGEGR